MSILSSGSSGDGVFGNNRLFMLLKDWLRRWALAGLRVTSGSDDEGDRLVANAGSMNAECKGTNSKLICDSDNVRNGFLLGTLVRVHGMALGEDFSANKFIGRGRIGLGNP